MWNQQTVAVSSFTGNGESPCDPMSRARNLMSHYMVNYILRNMSKNHRFGRTSSVPPLQQGTYHA